MSFNMHIVIACVPVVVAVYTKAIKVTVDGPREPRRQQQHYFDSRLTYHASRSAMGVGMGAAGYPLTNSWGYQTSYPASAYLGYNSAGMAGAAAYTSSLSGYTSSVIDPLLTTSGTAGTGTISSDTTASPASGLAREVDGDTTPEYQPPDLPDLDIKPDMMKCQGGLKTDPGAEQQYRGYRQGETEGGGGGYLATSTTSQAWSHSHSQYTTPVPHPQMSLGVAASSIPYHSSGYCNSQRDIPYHSSD